MELKGSPPNSLNTTFDNNSFSSSGNFLAKRPRRIIRRPLIILLPGIHAMRSLQNPGKNPTFFNTKKDLQLYFQVLLSEYLKRST